MPLFLLGAGASIDAGLPGSERITDLLFGRKSQSGRTLKEYLCNTDHPAIDLLCRLYSESVDQDTGLATMGFEQLFDRLEAMIESGNPAIQLDGTLDSVSSSWLSDPHAHLILRTIKRAAISLAIPMRYDLSKIAYLKSLVDKCLRERTPIVTLNYDLIIETILQGMGAEADCGPVKCAYPAPVTGKTLRLIKLHGSLDWSSDIPSGSSRGAASPALIEHGIIAGKKLTHHSPFWEEYLEFRKQVATADMIIAIGFSFQDPHVTDPLIEWLYGETSRSLHIVTPTSLPKILQFRLSPEVKGRCFHHKMNAAKYLESIE